MSAGLIDWFRPGTSKLASAPPAGFVSGSRCFWSLRACLGLRSALFADDLPCSCAASAGGCDSMTCIAAELQALEQGKVSGLVGLVPLAQRCALWDGWQAL